MVEPASKAKKLIAYVHRILKEERDLVIESRPLEATELHVDNIRWTFVFYESGLAINVLYTLDNKKKRAVGFKLSDGMEVPTELASRFKFARQKSKLAGTIRGSFFVIKGSIEHQRSAELLGESEEKSFRSPDVAEPIRVLVLDYFADELRAELAEPRERIVDVLHGEHDAEVAESVHRGAPVIGDDRRREKSRELEPAVAVRGAHHGHLDPLVAQPVTRPPTLLLSWLALRARGPAR